MVEKLLKLKIVGMIPVFNEVEIISEVLDHLLEEDIELVVLDNGSTDGSYEICKKYAEKGLIELEQIITPKFNWHLVLRMLYDMALKKNPDWVLRCDQDEFLESGVKDQSLRNAITTEHENGFNLMQFDVFEFFMTDDDNVLAKSVRKKFSYYSWQHDNAYRAWKISLGIRVEDAHGHFPIFPPHLKYRMSDSKYVLRHYRFRNMNQAKSNNNTRIQRLNGTSLDKINGCRHWKVIAEKGGPEFVDHNLLYKYDEDNQWNHKKIFRPYTFESKTRQQIFQDGKPVNQFRTTLEVQARIRQQRQRIQRLEKELSEKSQLDQKNKT